MPFQFFVTGTDTNVGKTVVSAILTTGLKGFYWKPIQTGEESDTKWIQSVSDLPVHHFLPEVYHLRDPLAPSQAAANEGITIELEAIPKRSEDPLIIEGAGGVMVPLNSHHLIIHLIKKMAIPTIVVCRTSLGTINHTLMTIQTLKNEEIPILGVVMNGPKNTPNRQTIEKHGQVPVLAEIELVPHFNSNSLNALFNHHFNFLMASSQC
jgi:dethiobiotin synthase